MTSNTSLLAQDVRERIASKKFRELVKFLPKSRQSHVRWINGLNEFGRAVATDIRLLISPKMNLESDGVTDVKDIIQAFINENAGGTCVIPKGDYFINLTGYNDSISIPSFTTVLCEKGANFIYNKFGIPCFNMTEVTDASFIGYTFIYTGTYPTSWPGTSGFPGSGGFKAWTYSVPTHRFAADISILGSHRCTVKGRHMSGPDQTNVQNVGVQVEGPDNPSLYSYGHNIDIETDMRCIGVCSSGWERFTCKVDANRVPQNSRQLYGPAHVVYDVIERLSRDGTYILLDKGNWTDVDAAATTGGTQTECHTLSLKWGRNIRAIIESNRTCGPLNFTGCENCVFDLQHRYVGTVSTGSVGHVYYTGQGNVPSYNNTINLNSQLTGDAHDCVFVSTKDTSNQMIYGTKINLTAYRKVSGSENPLTKLGGVGESIDVTSFQDGNNTRAVVNFSPTASSCIARINGASGGDRVNWETGASGCVAQVLRRSQLGSTVESLPQGTGAKLIAPKNDYSFSQNFSGVTSVSRNVQLPSGDSANPMGAYDVWVSVCTQDFNHIMMGWYKVFFQDQGADITNVQLVGSKVTGGASAPADITVTVTKAGLLTIAATGLASNNWKVEWGYREMYQR